MTMDKRRLGPLMLAGALLFAGCADKPAPTTNQDGAAQHHAMDHEAMEAPGEHHGHQQDFLAGEGGKELPGDSLFQLTSTWTDQDGETLQLADLGGGVSVVSMAYTRCTYTCPAITSAMKHIERNVGEATGEAPRMVLVSMDPAHDTPEVLKAFTKERELATPPWVLLHGDEADVREISAVLGINYVRREDGEYDHGVVLTVVDAQGRMVYRHEGLEGAVKGVTREVVALAGE